MSDVAFQLTGLALKDALEAQALELPQVECPIEHSFAAGLYVRSMFAPAGTLVIGHCHKFETHNVMLKGRALFLKDDGSIVEVAAPQSFVSQPGRKIALVLEDMVWQNFHPQLADTVEKMEELLIEKSEAFLAHEQAKKLISKVQEASEAVLAEGEV